jgi:amino acid transporter
MSNAALAGLLLIAIGISAFAYQGITYTSQRNVVDLGPLQVNVDEEKKIPIAFILGGLTVLGGAILLLSSRKRA